MLPLEFFVPILPLPRPVFSAFLATLSGLGLCALNASAQQVQYSSVHRQAERALPQTITGTAAVRKQLGSVRSGISLATGDFDADGTPDLVTGYAVGMGGALTLQRGYAGATSPSPCAQTL
jgi:hypothetical protein